MSKFPNIPLEVIAKGRNMEDVLAAYLDFFKDAGEVAAADGTAAGESDDEVIAGATMCAVYRLYLLGVEDGMKNRNSCTGRAEQRPEGSDTSC